MHGGWLGGLSGGGAGGALGGCRFTHKHKRCLSSLELPHEAVVRPGAE